MGEEIAPAAEGLTGLPKSKCFVRFFFFFCCWEEKADREKRQHSSDSDQDSDSTRKKSNLCADTKLY